MSSEKNLIPKFIGARVTRREDPALITGAGKYVADFALEGMLHMVLVRSPYAHARVLGIDTRTAQAMPGVVAVVTAVSIHPHLKRPIPMVAGMGRKYREAKNPQRYPLATDKVRHVGEAVAVVLAETPYQATDAAEAVLIDYEPLPVVIDPQTAVSATTLLHEQWQNNIAFRWENGADNSAVFQQAEVVTELSLVNQRVIAHAMEPRAVLATYDAKNNSYTIWATTQIPHGFREDIAPVLGVPEAQLRVIAPEVGGGFGVKANIYSEDILAPALARLYGRPIKWVATRSEDNVSTAQGRGQTATIKLAADKNGRIQAVDLKILYDCGAYYSRVTPGIPPLTSQMITGVYDIPQARTEITAVFTNKPPAEPYRGAGRPEAIYYIERALDALAAQLNLDPVEVRRRNFIAPNKFPYKTAGGSTYDSGEYGRSLDLALQLADYPALRAEQTRRRNEPQIGRMGGMNTDKLLGIGVACYVEICGFGPWEAGGVTVDAQGKVTVLTGTSPQGQGHQTSWAQIAADILQIPLADITVKHGDTAVVPRGIGTFGSRSAAVGGSAVYRNAETVREKASRMAAHLLEAAEVDVVLENGRFQVRGVPARSLSWQEIAQAAYSQSTLPKELKGGLTADTDYKPQGETYPFGTHLCVVEIDPETGEIEIVQYLTVDDCGYVINPLLVEGQVHGGIAQGIGQALWEAATYDDIGNLLTGTLMDYAVPRADRLPSYQANRTETPSPLNPLGVKGIGEAGTIGATPAVVNAVVDALSHLGVHHVEMPLAAEKIWHILQPS